MLDEASNAAPLSCSCTYKKVLQSPLLHVCWSAGFVTGFVIMLSTLLHAFLLFHPHVLSVSRLEGTEEKLRNRESRPEDLHIIAELREMVTEREALVKKLVVSRLAVMPPRFPISLVHLSCS